MKLRISIAVLTLAFAAALLPAAAAADPSAAWELTISPFPANFAPGQDAEYEVVATNVGAAETAGTPTIVSLTLPVGLDPVKAEAVNLTPASTASPTCTISGQTATCETSQPVGPGRFIAAGIGFQVPAGAPEEALAPAEAGVVGGGGTEVLATAAAPVRSAPQPFGILAGLRAPLIGEDGSPTTQAGSHPYQQSVDFGFPVLRTRNGTNSLYTNSGHPRDAEVELPPGLVVDPAATPVLCTEVELQSDAGCPEPSQVGTLNLTTLFAEGVPITFISSLYNMVPPPGYPAELAFNAATAGIYVHILGGVRSDGDYGIEANSPDLPAFGKNPIFNLHTQLWGDPSSEAHLEIRGHCRDAIEAVACPIAPQPTAFLTMPGSCTGQPLRSEVSVDSWEEPGLFKSAGYESADLHGNPVSVTDCGSLSFAPRIAARATTNLADSPSGLDFRLHQPQDMDKEHRSSAELEDAAVTLPAGMAVNPSQADGLAACSSQQIGLATEPGATPVHFDKTPNSCPDASKLGTVEVRTPLLVQRDSEHKLQIDPETGEPKPEPLHGAVYLAKPFENPFGSLLAIYLAVEDPRSGTIAKLAGRIEPDPQTGQLTTRFTENPQLPIEDIGLELFKGARAPLITPPTCGTQTTTTDLVPWSSPEGADAHPSDSFQTTAAPGGGACPATEAAAPDAPAFTAGTLTREAGKFSPFVLRVSREDGSQRLSRIDTLLPPGLAARFAGVGECSEAQIARAAARSHPEEGILERRDPSCPASSQLGTVVVGAGAGPTPFYTQGHVYLAGPYKGAPLSLAILTPAIAGPFDLGVVVVRTALHVEPETAQGRAVSDPLPTILDGIPLDVRSIALKLDRPDFTLNPTSCDPLAITGAATSALGAAAALNQPFQVGGCSALAFKPKLSLSLKGGTRRSSNPRLIADLKAKPGEANIARAQVKLPHAAFLDQAHIRTVCTRVQFAADSCPPGSIYGKATATTPLLDYTLSGPVYLRSSSRLLPDLVVKLKGPVSQPIEIDLAGKTDSVKAALRNTFEAVPDAPVSSFHLELFGGRRGLVVLSRNLCAGTFRAVVHLDGQNGKVHDARPKLGTSCKGRRKAEKHHGRGRR